MSCPGKRSSAFDTLVKKKKKIKKDQVEHIIEKWLKKIVKGLKLELFIDMSSKYIATFLWDYFIDGRICSS